MNHDELRDLVPIYALDALGGDEELEVRSHVEACEPCRLLLESHLDAAAGLALAAESVTPPADLRSRLMAAVAASPQEASLPRAVPLRSLRPDSSGIALVQIRTNLSNMQGMAVTLEAKAGNLAPQGPFVLKS